MWWQRGGRRPIQRTDHVKAPVPGNVSLNHRGLHSAVTKKFVCNSIRQEDSRLVLGSVEFKLQFDVLKVFLKICMQRLRQDGESVFVPPSPARTVIVDDSRSTSRTRSPRHSSSRRPPPYMTCAISWYRRSLGLYSTTARVGQFSTGKVGQLSSGGNTPSTS